MKSWLKKHFIPHLGNGHRPHFLHRKTLKKVVGILVLAELILFVLPTIRFAEYVDNLNLGSVLPAVLSNLTNEERGKQNLSQLTVNPLLERAAELKAKDMASKGYFAHNSPEGLTPWYWFETVGYKYRFAGENLAVNFTDSHEVTEAWMRSPTHQANIVNRNYTEVGTGIATGVYKGREVVFVAQLYGNPVVPVTSVAVAGVPNVSQTASVPQPLQTSANTPNQGVLGVEEALSASSAEVQPPNQIQRLMTSPRESANAILLAVLAVVVAALLLNIVIKFEHHHPDLIWNGLLVCLIIGMFYFGNGLFARQGLETSFIDFSQTETQV